MHGKSAEERNAFFSMLEKDHNAHGAVTREYINHWESDGVAKDDEVAREERKSKYMSLVNKSVLNTHEPTVFSRQCAKQNVNSHYDLATDLYEEGWAQSFHLCRFAANESFLQALARHEQYLAHRINIDESMTVLDVGCGVGKPAREIATFTGCNVVGLNNNAYQIERATAHAVREGLAGKVSFVKGDFMVRSCPSILINPSLGDAAVTALTPLRRMRIWRRRMPARGRGMRRWRVS
jgi:sterol 24-C-methyltransferase